MQLSNNKTLVNVILKKLRDEIIQGVLKPKEKIFEEETAKRFKVSRAPIREVFRILESEGLIKIVPRKGFFVADIDDKDVEALYAIRPVLEGLAARMACQNMSDRDLEKLSRIISIMREATERNDLKLYFKLNKEFHGCICKRINNEILSKILINLENQAMRYRFFAIALDNRIRQSLKNHIELYNALCDRNENEVERLRRLHVESGGNALKRIIKKKDFF